MSEATTTETSRETRRSSRPANGNATDNEKAKFEVLADKLYRALLCARSFASEKSKSPEHTVLRFSVAGDVISLTAYDGKVLCDLRVPAEASTKPTSFRVQVRFVPTLIRMLAALHQDEREKTSATITVGKREVELSVDASRHRVPQVEEQLEIAEVNKLIPPESVNESDVYSAVAFGISPVIAAKLFGAAKSVSSSLKASSPRASDSPIRFDIREGKAGITGFFVLASASLATQAAEEDDDRNEEIDFEDDDEDDSED